MKNKINCLQKSIVRHYQLYLIVTIMEIYKKMSKMHYRNKSKIGQIVSKRQPKFYKHFSPKQFNQKTSKNKIYNLRMNSQLSKTLPNNFVKSTMFLILPVRLNQKIYLNRTNLRLPLRKVQIEFKIRYNCISYFKTSLSTKIRIRKEMCFSKNI